MVNIVGRSLNPQGEPFSQAFKVWLVDYGTEASTNTLYSSNTPLTVTPDVEGFFSFDVWASDNSDVLCYYRVKFNYGLTLKIRVPYSSQPLEFTDLIVDSDLDTSPGVLQRLALIEANLGLGGGGTTFTPRDFSLGGLLSSDPVTFDGTANVVLAATGVTLPAITTGLGLMEAEYDGSQAVEISVDPNEVVFHSDPALEDAREWIAPTVTQPEAESSSNTDRFAWTPQRVWQAISAWWVSSSDKTKLDSIEAGADISPVQSVAGRVGDISLSSVDVGLGNVSNVDSTNASNITSGTLGLDRLPGGIQADTLVTPRNINGVPFDGSQDITIATGGGGDLLPLSSGTGIVGADYDGSTAQTWSLDNAAVTTIVSNWWSSNSLTQADMPNPLVATTADTLTTPRNINGVAFDGSQDITIPNGLLDENGIYNITASAGQFNSSVRANETERFRIQLAQGGQVAAYVTLFGDVAGNNGTVEFGTLRGRSYEATAWENKFYNRLVSINEADSMSPTHPASIQCNGGLSVAKRVFANRVQVASPPSINGIPFNLNDDITLPVVEDSDSRLTNSREWVAPTVTQVEAETGTSEQRRAWTPLRVIQAIAAWWSGSPDKTKLDGIEAGAQVNTITSVNGQTGDVTISAASPGTLTPGSGLLGGTFDGSTNQTFSIDTNTVLTLGGTQSTTGDKFINTENRDFALVNSTGDVSNYFWARPSTNELLIGSTAAIPTFRSRVILDNETTSTSNTTGAVVVNNQTGIGGGNINTQGTISAGGQIEASTQLILRDPPSGNQGFLRIDSNSIYFLVDRDASGSWETPHPLRLIYSSNTAQIFDKTVWTDGTLPAETGTFTPRVRNINTNEEPVYSSRYGEYTRIGHLVRFTIRVVIASVPASATNGWLVVDNLPFARTSTEAEYDAVSMFSWNCFEGYQTSPVTAGVTSSEPHIRFFSPIVTGGGVTSINYFDLRSGWLRLSGTYQTSAN